MESILERINFGNEAADDVDPGELATYFVEQSAFHGLAQARGKLAIAHARKGVGKSALLQWIGYRATSADKDAIVIKCRGADLVRSRFNLCSQLNEPNDHIRDWMIRICAIVNRHLAASLRIALTDDSITLVETAELDGFKARNFVGCLLDRLQGLLDRRGTEKLPAKDEIALMKRAKDRRVWLLIDDLDATFQNTPQECLSLSTFFSACRYLLQDVTDLVIRVTMRTDVWALIRRYDESLDKVEQYVHEVLWCQRDFLQLLSLRIKASMEAENIPLPVVPKHVAVTDAQERLLETVFEPKMEWAGHLTDTYRVLYTLSYERPRWAVQLCKLAQDAALRIRSNLISKDHIDQVWGEYGARRIADLVAEHKHQCRQVEELLNSFRGATRLMSRGELFQWINNRISQHMAPTIEGSQTRSPMEIARFLYRLGFILARSDSSDGNYEHYRFDQMPDFLSSRTDDDFGLKWEIHPCYREALDIKKLDRSHRERFGRLRKRW